MRTGSEELRPAKRGVPGFVLMELLIALVLLAVFMIIITQVFVLATRAHRDSIRRTAQVSRVDSAVRRLREDVWGAPAATVDAQGELHVTRAEGEVVWRVGPAPAPVLRGAEYRLERTINGARADQASWNGLPAATFSVSGQVVTLTFHTGAAGLGGDESVSAISPVMLQASPGGAP
ncbi:MAG TPA: hypothetical protein VH253_00685 [Phycisphaerae bacterium]|nr:hypothetical protein [Phycisphaerae bacterium]